MDNPIGKYLNGQLSPEEMEQFVEWLREDPARLEELAAAGTLELELYEVMRKDLFRKDVDEHLFSQAILQDHIESLLSEKDEGKPAQRNLLSSKESHKRKTSSRLVSLLLSIAAMVVIVLGIRQLQPRESPPVAVSPSNNEDVAGSTEPTPESIVVARLTYAADCQWSKESKIGEVGSDLLAGDKLALSAGTVRATFENGVRVTIEGPCDFQINNEMSGMLYFGRLAADVPEEAIGFSIKTPSTEVVDLGTAFGIEVDEQGKSEVHVFEGEVVTHHRNPKHLQDSGVLRLKSNDGARYGTSDQPDRISADPTRFARDVDTRLPKDKVPQLPIMEKLALWLAADQLTQLDEHQNVFIWGDILAGDNQSAEDAYQLVELYRPKFSPKAINGRPAISFDGESDYFTTSPLKTTNDQTVVFVAAFSSTPLKRGQLLNYNGPPYRKISKLTDPGILQIDAPLAIPAGQLTGPNLAGQVFFRKELDEPVPVGKTSWELPTDEPYAPFIGVYRYDTANDRASLWVNGVLVSEASAPWPAAITSRKVIGRHGRFRWHFHGDLAEMMIYNSAVNDSDLVHLCTYLSRRYAIPLK
ncbi:MAG: FecR domain-containing protein [Pirellulales bacterium]|nr:FecR domain-containing protein [Pirellulales bacterium]